MCRNPGVLTYDWTKNGGQVSSRNGMGRNILGIDLAEEELHQLVLETPGEYFLLDQVSGEKVFVPNQERPAGRASSRLG
jgi:hypothetical protein